MKTIIAGSRNIECFWVLEEAIEQSGFKITEVVSGCAKGVDRMGEVWAGYGGIPVKRFQPDWSKGKGAGLKRNIEMAEYAEALIAVWDGVSRGTKHMIDVAKQRSLQVFVFTYAKGKPA